MKRRNKTLAIVIAIIALPFVLGMLLKLYYLYGWDMETSESVKSPDGRYVAHLGYRGFVPDSPNTHLYVKNANTGNQDAVKVHYGGKIRWSPDSTIVATDDNQGMSFYAVKSSKFCECYVRNGAQNFQWLGPRTVQFEVSNYDINMHSYNRVYKYELIDAGTSLKAIERSAPQKHLSANEDKPFWKYQ